jgi:transcriptional regulator with XRE-family HTH domain
MCYSNRLKQFRKAAGLTQEHVADALGLEQNSVSKHERSRVLKSDVLLRYASLYGCRMDDLYVLEPDSSSALDASLNPIDELAGRAMPAEREPDASTPPAADASSVSAPASQPVIPADASSPPVCDASAGAAGGAQPLVRTSRRDLDGQLEIPGTPSEVDRA